MTKKHFQALAWELADVRPVEDDSDARDVWQECVNAVITVAREANAAFNRDLFLAACFGDAYIRDGRRVMVDITGRRFTI